MNTQWESELKEKLNFESDPEFKNTIKTQKHYTSKKNYKIHTNSSSQVTNNEHTTKDWTK